MKQFETWHWLLLVSFILVISSLILDHLVLTRNIGITLGSQTLSYSLFPELGLMIVGVIIAYTLREYKVLATVILLSTLSIPLIMYWEITSTIFVSQG